MLRAHERRDAAGNLFKIHILDAYQADGPISKDDLVDWSEEYLVKHIVNQALDPAAARDLAARWVLLATGLAPASVEFLRHVGAILLAVEQMRNQEAKRMFNPPAPVPVDPVSVQLDKRIQDYARRHRVPYAQAYSLVLEGDAQLAKSYARKPGQ